LTQEFELIKDYLKLLEESEIKLSKWLKDNKLKDDDIQDSQSK